MDSLSSMVKNSTVYAILRSDETERILPCPLERFSDRDNVSRAAKTSRSTLATKYNY